MARKLVITNTTTTSISVNITGLSTSYTYNGRVFYVHAYKGSKLISEAEKKVSAGVSQTGTITVKNLSPDTEYTIEVYVYMPDLEEVIQLEDLTTDGVYTNPEPILITKWSWTTTESNALKYHGAISTITAERWNELVNKVSEYRIAKGKNAWNNNYPASNPLTIDKVRMKTDKVLTADRYNSLKNNLGTVYPTGISDVNKGDEVKGRTHFIAFTDKLNEAIDQL